MEALLINYLFINKKCPLPGVGALHLVNTNASSAIGEMTITAPAPAIRFNNSEIPATHLIHYIATHNGISIDESITTLNNYCNRLNSLEADSELPIEGAGKFFVDADGNLDFTQTELNASFLPVVKAQRVIHPNESHSILVGDTQTTNTVMSDFYNEEEVKPRQRWWIWALAIFAVAVMVLLIYFNDKNSNGSFGNAQSYTLSD